MARIKKIGIYKITSKNNRIYIGQSRDIEKRFWGYKALTTCKSQTRLYRSFVKNGVDNHHFEIITECDLHDLNRLERYYQDLYHSCGSHGLNCKLTEAGDRVAVINEETRRKMSEAGVRKMKNISKTHLENIRKAAKRKIGTKGTPQTEAQRKATRERNLLYGQFKGKNNPMYNSQRFGEKNPFHNKKHTEESRLKISEKATGRVPSEEVRKIWSKNNSLGGNPAAKIVLDTESGIYYSCGKEAWLASNRQFVYSTFKSKLNGSNKYPLSFKYV